MKSLCRRYLPLSSRTATSAGDREILTQLHNDNEKHYGEANASVRAMAPNDVVSGAELSTMLNVNREIHHALRNLLMSIA